MKHGIRKIGIATAFAAIATQFAGCGATAGIQPSQTTCNQFLTQMKAHQYKAAYGFLTAQCKAVTTPQQMQNYWELIEKNRGSVQSWSQQGFFVHGGTGGSSVELTYGLQCANGSSGIKIKCVEENKKWLIQAFNVSG